jgi:hypothetical protein
VPHELNEATEALAELREADELGGYREERARQKKAEEAVPQSLELKRRRCGSPSRTR